MRKFGLMLSVAVLALPMQAWAAKVTVLSAARIHTMEVAQPRVQAMAYDEQGRILALGGREQPLQHPGPLHRPGEPEDLGEVEPDADDHSTVTLLARLRGWSTS